MHRYTDEQIAFLRENISGHSYAEAAELFNKHFGTRLSLNQIQGTLTRNKIRNGRNACFRPGQKAWNKGKKGLNIGGIETQFKKGSNPHNYRPLSSERVTVDGYVEVKVSEKQQFYIIRADEHAINVTIERHGANKWRMKHALIWEAAHGPVPEGHAVIFGDGDKVNFGLDNLILVSRAQLAVINKFGLIYSDAALTRNGILIADIHMKRRELEKRR